MYTTDEVKRTNENLEYTYETFQKLEEPEYPKYKEILEWVTKKVQ